jgi:hypothetical protein
LVKAVQAADAEAAERAKYAAYPIDVEYDDPHSPPKRGAGGFKN